MKKNASSSQHETAPQVKPAQRPQNKNNLDSREGEEQLTKGDDSTHNKKEHHKEPKKKQH